MAGEGRSRMEGRGVSLPRGRDLLGEVMAPNFRFIWGLALMPLIAFTAGWIPACADLTAAAILAIVSGKRIKPLNNLSIIALIAFFSLLNPHGLVLATLGPLRVTQGALLDGIERGAIIVCLVFVSRASVSPLLALPGRFGALLSGVFASFNRLMESKQKVQRRDWVASVDAILFGLFDPDAPDQEASAGPSRGTVRVSGPRFALGVVLAAFSWIAALAVLILSRA
jgi:hypothetical protein